MGKENGYREISNIEADYTEGLLFCGWTNKWGVKVYPWYEKDLITFAFIEKGQQGKGRSFDVSVPAKKNYSFDFMDFTHEVLQDIPTPYEFVSVMRTEREQKELYPKRYKFSSGADGEKSLGFCNSSLDGYEFCLNASTVKAGKKIFVNVPMSYYDIYELAEAFRETYAERNEQLKQIRKNGIVSRGERIRETSRKPVSSVEVTTTAGLTEGPEGEYTVTAVINDSENEILIHFPAEAINRMSMYRAGCFDEFYKQAGQKPTTFRFSGKRICRNGKDEYIFDQFVKK